MCEWLNLRPHSDTYKNIQMAIEALEKKKYVHHIQEGRTHTLSISNKGLADKRSVKVRKAWIETIHNYKLKLPQLQLGVDWAKLVKVFICCLCDNGDIRTIQERAEGLQISKDTFSRSLQILSQLDFAPLTLNVKTKKRHNSERDYWMTIGSTIVAGIDYSKESPNKTPYIEKPYWPDPEEYDYESFLGTDE